MNFKRLDHRLNSATCLLLAFMRLDHKSAKWIMTWTVIFTLHKYLSTSQNKFIHFWMNFKRTGQRLISPTYFLSAFMCVDHKSAKWLMTWTVIFTLYKYLSTSQNKFIHLWVKLKRLDPGSILPTCLLSAFMPLDQKRKMTQAWTVIFTLYKYLSTSQNQFIHLWVKLKRLDPGSISPTCLLSAFMCLDHKSAKWLTTWIVIFTLLGSAHVKT